MTASPRRRSSKLVIASDQSKPVAYVTGGAQGIGYAVAKRMIESGARVTLFDRDEAVLKEAAASLGDGAFTAVVDVTDPEGIAAAMQAVRARDGSVDIGINNAGIAGAAKPSSEYSPAEWREVIEIDLNGVFYCCQAAVDIMKEQNYGRIVNVASIAGKEGNPNATAYSAAKAGVIALTKSIAKEVAKQDIAINCVTPAAAKTRIFDQITQEHIDYMLDKIPRGRFLQVDEAAAMMAWLVSEENSFTTGAAFDLSGGRATY